MRAMYRSGGQATDNLLNQLHAELTGAKVNGAPGVSMFSVTVPDAICGCNAAANLLNNFGLKKFA
jgi:hypothetical protein